MCRGTSAAARLAPPCNALGGACGGCVTLRRGKHHPLVFIHTCMHLWEGCSSCGQAVGRALHWYCQVCYIPVRTTQQLQLRGGSTRAQRQEGWGRGGCCCARLPPARAAPVLPRFGRSRMRPGPPRGQKALPSTADSRTLIRKQAATPGGGEGTEHHECIRAKTPCTAHYMAPGGAIRQRHQASATHAPTSPPPMVKGSIRASYCAPPSPAPIAPRLA